MKITALEEYGLRCLLRVAEQTEGPNGEPISARDIAEAEGLSLPYTQKLLRALSDGDVVKAKRGAHGGYLLARPATDITVGDVMRQLGGMLEMGDFCEDHTGNLEVCCNAGSCAIRPVWSHISKFIIRTMDQISLEMLAGDDATVERFLAEREARILGEEAPESEKEQGARSAAGQKDTSHFN